MSSQARYIIGIDLGTTNSCMSYVDTLSSSKSPPIQLFSIPQVVNRGHVESKPLLPSFCFLHPKGENLEQFRLPWSKSSTNHTVGVFAQKEGAKTPTCLVQSAKSWLCNGAANRRDKILPVDSANFIEKISPVTTISYYLSHMRDAWNYIMAAGDPSCEFEQQDILITVPASFDEVARSLTVEAAKLTGCMNFSLLEEPQAAFYCFLSHDTSVWQKQLKADDSILICDVGGGTTDFSLIEVKEIDQKLTFQRMAVGEHLLLGGDNMDVALSHYIEEQLHKSGLKELNTVEWLQLIHEAKAAKEHLLSEQSKDAHYKVTLQSSGSGVIGNTKTSLVSKEEVSSLLLEGFFGQYTFIEALSMNKSVGFRSMGLPYEAEPSITRHLASFLDQAIKKERSRIPNYVLFNGGAMKPRIFQEAVVSSISRWFNVPQPSILPSLSLDFAVARGASYYGKVKRGLGIKIQAGSPRSYYLGIDLRDKNGNTTYQAMTLLPRGSQEGSRYTSLHLFHLQPNTPVIFQLYTSQTRLHDESGEMVSIHDAEMHKLPPLCTVLRFGKGNIGPNIQETVPVSLGIELTEIGTIALWLQSKKTEHKWMLEFQIRSAEGHDETTFSKSLEKNETFDTKELEPLHHVILESFRSTNPSALDKLMETLEEMLERPRRDWPLSILRSFSQLLGSIAPFRKLSEKHEIRFWNFSGFVLRPGMGFPLDDFRMKEFWKVILSDHKDPFAKEVAIHKWICYRRVAAGLSRGQQIQLASELLSSLGEKKDEH